MRNLNLMAGAAALALVAGAAVAGPTSIGKKVSRPGPISGPSGGVAADFTENFDSYANGSSIFGQGGWEAWPGSAPAIVSNEKSHSAPNSLKVQPLSDVVHQFSGIDDGQWEMSVWTYYPSTSTGGQFIIMLNQYDGGGAGTNWSMQIAINQNNAGIVESQFDGAQVPVIKDQWVEFRAEIDLDADVWNSWYGGTPLTVNGIWSDMQAGTPGITSIAAVDLFSEAAEVAYYDDFSLVEAGAGCYPDCDGDEILSIDDFVCFQTFFAFGDPYADCDGDTILSIDDFVCFQTFFAFGCD